MFLLRNSQTKKMEFFSDVKLQNHVMLDGDVYCLENKDEFQSFIFLCMVRHHIKVKLLKFYIKKNRFFNERTNWQVIDYTGFQQVITKTWGPVDWTYNSK